MPFYTPSASKTAAIPHQRHPQAAARRYAQFPSRGSIVGDHYPSWKLSPSSSEMAPACVATKTVHGSDYGEGRVQALGLIDGRLHMLVFTMRGYVMRAIHCEGPMPEKGNTMKKLEPPPADFDENPGWTAEDFARAQAFKEGFPEFLDAWKERKNKGGRPPVEQPKVHIGFRLAADVVEGIRASGKGYNARVERLLREALAKGLL
jgi:uncharacterized protein (DUF4415 family)